MSDTADAAGPPVLEIAGARATIRLNRPQHLNGSRRKISAN